MAAIEVEGLVKTYGETRALDGLDLRAEAGAVLAVLGPNGAGKTTAVRVLTTLTPPDSGRARVAGYDVVDAAAEVRRRIGLTGQYASVDESLTGTAEPRDDRPALPASRAARRARSGELLEQFTLTHAADRPVKTYSGGMRRRLDLAASLLGEPEILFLDEPTTGLDPTGRSRTWDIIRDLIDGGTTILLTTQYLEEADQLADRIVVVDGGRAIAEGTSDELKAMVGTNHVDVTISADSSFDDARRVLEPHAPGAIHVDTSARLLSMPAQSDEPGLVTTVVGALAASGVLVDALDVRRPSLDDVFLELTGHTAEQPPADVEEEAA